MTTITRDLAKLFRKITNSEIDSEGNAHAVLSPADSTLINRARIALASLEAEPVAWTDADELRDANNGGSGYLFSIGGDANKFADPHRQLVLYTAPPAPVVPDAISTRQAIAKMENHEPCDSINVAYKFGWNACRAALLQGSQPVSNRDELPEEKGASLQLRNLIRRRHAEWSEKTFGNVGPIGPLKHLSKEALEAAAEPDDLSEWADMQFLLWDAQRRAGISDGEITAAMEEKLKVNMARQWPEPKDGEPRLHIKSDQRQEHM